MNSDMDSAYLLQDLQQLSEAGRERILRRLPREDIIEILKAAFQRLDDAQEQRTSSDRTLTNACDDHEPGCPTSESKPEHIFDQVRDQTHIQSQTLAVVSAHEQPCTEDVLQIVESQPQENNTQRMKRYMVAKSEWDVRGYNDYESDDQHEAIHEHTCAIISSSEGAEAHTTTLPAHELAFRVRNKKDDLVVPHVSQNTTFPIMLSVPTTNNGFTLETIDKLSQDVRSKLENSFVRMRSASKSRADRYRRLEKNPTYYAKKPTCIRDHLVCTAGDFDIGATFRKTGKASADTRCVKAREPCTYLIMLNDHPMMCMVPLPEAQRVGKAWTELEYWIRD